MSDEVIIKNSTDWIDSQTYPQIYKPFKTTIKNEHNKQLYTHCHVYNNYIF